MLVAAVAMAGVPSASNSTVAPTFVRLNVNKVGVPDTLGANNTVVITIRDLANNPVIGSNVVIDISACAAADMRLGNNQYNANYIVNCTGKTVGGYTNAAGQVRFTLIGGSTGSTVSPIGIGCGRIYADGVLISSPTVPAYDLNNAGGLGAADVGVLLGDIGAYIAGGSVPAAVRGRSDLDGNASLGAADLGILLAGIGRAVTGTPSTSTLAC
jgi:hypothetical protein